ncbi:unnamed protein product [Cylicocyclus nassatus]|uniref:Uncharacterized protein n=1 Tax=Cylicocyclus nassatus TaxID=53992 RepID=A0AA36H250_CYLNA|nr:unnamed protein product [Cylicocyclus nassatus]CAJ0602309.1 unnamed protein product [Cylicocyclus nassatus]
MANDAVDATVRMLLSEFAGKQLPLMQQLVCGCPNSLANMANDAVDATVPRVWLSEFAGKQWQTMPLMLQLVCAVRIRWQTMANDAVDATVRVLLSEFAGKQWQTMPLMLQFVSGCPNSLANNGKRCR